MTYEEEILAKNSTPGLRRNELNRAAKKDHLLGLKVSREETEKILNQLYPEEKKDDRPDSRGNTGLPAAQPANAEFATDFGDFDRSPTAPAPAGESHGG